MVLRTETGLGPNETSDTFGVVPYGLGDSDSRLRLVVGPFVFLDGQVALFRFFTCRPSLGRVVDRVTGEKCLLLLLWVPLSPKRVSLGTIGPRF